MSPRCVAAAVDDAVLRDMPLCMRSDERLYELGLETFHALPLGR